MTGSVKRALLTVTTGNSVGLEDMRAVKCLLESAGYLVDEIVELRKLVSKGHIPLPIEEYSLIGLSVPYAALHMSGALNLTGMKELLTRAREGSLALFTADTKLPMNPKMWDGPNSTPHKENPYLLRSVKVIGSFQDRILEDEVAMARVKQIWLKHLHKDSEFLPLEWTSGMVHFLPKALEETKAKANLFSHEEPINRFYYGILKPKLIPSLKRLGLGESPEDAAFGPIAKRFPGARDLSPLKGSPNPRELWVPLVKRAKMNLLPYDPVKSDYQFTKRFLELAVLNPESVVADPRIKPELLEYLKVEPWERKAKEVALALSELF